MESKGYESIIAVLNKGGTTGRSGQNSFQFSHSVIYISIHDVGDWKL